MKKASLFFFLLYSIDYVVATEKIINLDSDVTISKEGNIVVTEKIKVNAEGFHVQRGIKRYFPTRNIRHFTLSKLLSGKQAVQQTGDTFQIINTQLKINDKLTSISWSYERRSYGAFVNFGGLPYNHELHSRYRL